MFIYFFLYNDNKTAFRDMNAELLHVHTDQTWEKVFVDTCGGGGFWGGRVSLDGAEAEIHVEMSGLDMLPSLRAGGQDDGGKLKKVTELDGDTGGVIYQQSVHHQVVSGARRSPPSTNTSAVPPPAASRQLRARPA